MKLKRILAAALAGVIAVTSSVVTSVTAVAAETSAYINLKGNTTNWAMNIDYAGKTMISEGTNSYEISVKNESSYADTLAALAINFYDPDSTGSLKDLKVTDVKVDGVSKGVAIDTFTKEAYLWNGSASVTEGYYISLTADDFASIGSIDVGGTLTVVISATYEAPDTSGSDVWVKNADGTYTLTRGNAETVPNLLLNLSDYTDADYADIIGISVDVEIQEGNGYTNGGFGLNDAVSGWVQTSWNESGSNTLALEGVEAGQQLNFQIWGASVGVVVTVVNVNITVAESEPTIYAITVDEAKNGTVEVDKETAEAGEKVTVTAKPAEGYEVDTITIAGETTEPFGVDANNQFEMPAEDVTVTATFKAIEVETVTVTPEKQSVVAGETVTLTAEVEPENAKDKTIDWSSSDTTVATVDEKGVVTAVKAGTATITAESVNGIKGTCVITVTDAKIPATAVTLSKTELDLDVNASATITATVTPADTTDTVVWTSSDATVATVTGGKITAVKAGTATITATAGEVSAKCVVTVLAEGNYADGEWVQLSDEEIKAAGTLNTITTAGEEYVTTSGELSVQYSATEKKLRIYQICTAADLEGKTSASIVVKKGDVALKLTTSKVYTKLAEGVTAPEDCYYVAWVISEVDAPADFSYSAVTFA